MREQSWQKRTATRAFHELRRTQKQTENDARHRRIWNIARSDVNLKFRRVDDRHAILLLLGGGRRQGVEPLGIAEFLDKQRVKIFTRELLEKIIQPARQSFARKTCLRRAKFQREFAKQFSGCNQPSATSLKTFTKFSVERFIK